MAIWAIPPDKVINYSRTGDDVDLFAQKTKFCLEEAFVSLKYLYDKIGSLSTTGEIGGISFALDNLADGQTVVYDAATKTFVNRPPVELKLEQTVNELRTTVVNISDDNAQKIRHLQRLVENIYLALDVAELNPGGYDNLHVATFFSDLNYLDTARSSFTLNDGKIFGGAILVTNPIYFAKNVSNAHLIIKHTNISGAEISAELALYDALAGEIFLPMTKTDTYPDKENSERATTEFIYSGAAGNVATLRITLSGDFQVDSFACTFDE